jgi:hypothetical protein
MLVSNRTRSGSRRYWCIGALAVFNGIFLAATSTAHAFESRAKNTSNWSSSFNAAPTCTGAGCHDMNRASFGPAGVRVLSTAGSAQVSVSGTNGTYYWRYRQGASASEVFTSTQTIGSLGSGVNQLDFCVVEVTAPSLGRRDWNCGDFEITRNRVPTVNLNQSSVSLETGDSTGVTVDATDDLPGLSYSASADSTVVQVSGSGPGFTVNANRAGSANVTFTVTDSDGESSRQQLSVTVSDAPEPNQPPRIDSISPDPASLEVGDSIVVRVNASDDKPGLNYAATTESPLVSISGSGPEFTVGGTGQGSAELQFTVTDSDGASAMRVLQVRIEPAPSTDGGSDGNTDGSADGSTDGNADGGADGSTDGSTDGNTDGSTDGNTDGSTDGSTDGNTDGSADGSTDGSSAECIDTDPIGDGWGWNGSSSCRVDAGGGGETGGAGGNDCVDTDPVGDGWGWDGTQSCRVDAGGGDTGGSGGAVCVDTDPVGDGWGWDGTQSCRVDADGGDSGGSGSADCVDTDPVGDGWGWDGSQSCRVDADADADAGGGGSGGAECIDTDPVGDGWGWDGSQSCRVDTDGGDTGGSGGAECIDTDPVGDGWGWDGSQSCRVDAGGGDSGGAACVDTDPVGDGWGWDGSSSCRVGASGGFSGRSSDGQWPICYTGVGAGSTEAWQVQIGVETGVAESCVKKCPADYVRDQSYPGWGWNRAQSTSCVESGVDAGSNASVPVYVDGDRLAFESNLSRANLIRSGGSWSCQRQTRADASVPFANSGPGMSLQFSADGALSASGNNSATWSLSGRLLRLQTSPEMVYRNVRFDGNLLYLYETTEVRYRCQ